MLNKCLIFTSKTCKDCFALSSNYSQLEQQFPNLEFEYIDVSEQPDLAVIHNIYTVPAIELYQNNQLVAEFKHGANMQYSSMINFIKLHLELRKEE